MSSLFRKIPIGEKPGKSRPSTETGIVSRRPMRVKKGRRWEGVRREASGFRRQASDLNQSPENPDSGSGSEAPNLKPSQSACLSLDSSITGCLPFKGRLIEPVSCPASGKSLRCAPSIACKQGTYPERSPLPSGERQAVPVVSSVQADEDEENEKRTIL